MFDSAKLMCYYYISKCILMKDKEILSDYIICFLYLIIYIIFT